MKQFKMANKKKRKQNIIKTKIQKNMSIAIFFIWITRQKRDCRALFLKECGG